VKTYIRNTAVACAVLSFASGLACDGQESGGRVFNPRVVIKRPFRAIVSAPVVAAGDITDAVVKDDELVLGVTEGDESRAYPINMLCGPRREIINDELGGRSIAATW
jgi:hypothetical protein